LRRDRSAKGMSKTPLLGDVPLLGRLFRNPSRASRHNTLLIFITTTIVDEFTHPEVAQLTDTMENISKDLRHNEKSLWKRMQAGLPPSVQGHLPGFQKEIGVTIGQSGQIYSEGRLETLESLQEKLSEFKMPSQVRVILRRHPRAPAKIVEQVTAAAKEAKVSLEVDNTLVPLVPSYHTVAEESPAEPEAPEEIESPPEAGPPAETEALPEAEAPAAASADTAEPSLPPEAAPPLMPAVEDKPADSVQ